MVCQAGLIAYTVAKDRERDVVFQHFAGLIRCAHEDGVATRNDVGTVSCDRILARPLVIMNDVMPSSQT